MEKFSAKDSGMNAKRENQKGGGKGTKNKLPTKSSKVAPDDK